MKETNKQVLYSSQQAADFCRCHNATINRWISGGKLKAVKIGSRWKIKESALRECLGKDAFRLCEERVAK